MKADRARYYRQESWKEGAHSLPRSKKGSGQVWSFWVHFSLRPPPSESGTYNSEPFIKGHSPYWYCHWHLRPSLWPRQAATRQCAHHPLLPAQI